MRCLFLCGEDGRISGNEGRAQISKCVWAGGRRRNEAQNRQSNHQRFSRRYLPPFSHLSVQNTLAVQVQINLSHPPHPPCSQIQIRWGSRRRDPSLLGLRRRRSPATPTSTCATPSTARSASPSPSDPSTSRSSPPRTSAAASRTTYSRSRKTSEPQTAGSNSSRYLPLAACFFVHDFTPTDRISRPRPP